MSKLSVFINTHEELVEKLKSIFSIILAGIGLSPDDQSAAANAIAELENVVKEIAANLQSLQASIGSDPAAVSADLEGIATEAAKAVGTDIMSNLAGIVGDLITKNIPDIIAKAEAAAKDAATAAVTTAAADAKTLEGAEA